ncbi:MAG: hypothetical protein ACRDHO_09880, partial [Actinomycetota bacterium]
MSLAERLGKTERVDKASEIQGRLQARLVETLGPKLYDQTISERDLQDLVHRRLAELLDEERLTLSNQEKAR